MTLKKNAQKKYISGLRIEKEREILTTKPIYS
jgi:hypothetical protein